MDFTIKYCQWNIDLYYVEHIPHQICSMETRPPLRGSHSPSDIVNGYQTSTERNAPIPFHQIWLMDTEHPLYIFNHIIDIVNKVQTSTAWNTLNRVTFTCLNDLSFMVTTLYKF